MPRHRRRRRGGAGGGERGGEGASPRENGARPAPAGRPETAAREGRPERPPRPERGGERGPERDGGNGRGPERGEHRGGDRGPRGRGRNDRPGRRPQPRPPAARPRPEAETRSFLPGPRSRTGDTFLIRGASLVSFSPPRVERADLLVRGGIIAGKVRGMAAPPDAEMIDGNGRIVIPGLVDLFADFAARPFAGLPAPGLKTTERGRAESATHDEASVICRAFAGSIHAVLRGVTTVFSLHGTPRFVAGSPTRLRDVLLSAGLRAVIGYRVSGEASGQAELEASREALRLGGGEQLRAMLGLADRAHVGAPELAAMARLREAEGVLLLAEACGPEAIARLEAAGLLDERTAVAVAGPLGDAAWRQLHSSAATPVLVPRSLLGTPLPPLGNGQSLRFGLGSGPHRQDLLGDARLVAGMAEAQGSDDAAALALAGLARSHEVASRVFEMQLGSFEPGAAADLVVLELPLTMPLNAATVAAHVVYGLPDARIRLVMVGGRPVVRDGRHATVDVQALFVQVQRGSLDHWERLTGQPFPGLQESRSEERALAEAAAAPPEPPRIDLEEPADTENEEDELEEAVIGGEEDEDSGLDEVEDDDDAEDEDLEDEDDDDELDLEEDDDEEDPGPAGGFGAGIFL